MSTSEEKESTLKRMYAVVQGIALKENVNAIVIGIAIVIILICWLVYAIFIWTQLERGCKKMDNLYSNLDGALRSLNPSDPNCQYLLYDYYIKSAYNCCSIAGFKNSHVSTCGLKDILKQGVRCLDFEIYSASDGQPVVATSTSDSIYYKETFNSVPFADVMTIVKNYAFATSSSPNPKDPIFFHFRFRTDDQRVYQNLADLFKSYDDLFLGPEFSYENNGQNFGATPLINLCGKIVVIADKTNNSFVDCKDFYEYVNMASNSMFMRAIPYDDVKNVPDMSELQQYNTIDMTIVLPNKNSNSTNPSGIVSREMGCQMVAMMYQYNDNNLQETNTFFDNCGYAFCLKPETLRNIPQNLPDPPPQNPELSYATRTVSSDYYSFQV
jgi:hypothetical protein